MPVHYNGVTVYDEYGIYSPHDVIGGGYFSREL